MERNEVRFKTLRNLGAAISEKTRPLWMLAFLTTGGLALVGVEAASALAAKSALAYGMDYGGDKLLLKPDKIGRRNPPTFASDLRNAIAMPGRLIGKVRRW